MIKKYFVVLSLLYMEVVIITLTQKSDKQMEKRHYLLTKCQFYHSRK